MLLHLEDFRYLINGFIDHHDSGIDQLPSPSIVRYIISFFPNSIRQHWANLAEKYQEGGKPWQEAEWKALCFIVRDTDRYEQNNPNKPIKWRYPDSSLPLESSDACLDVQITPDEYFFAKLKAGAEYNASLGKNANEILDELESKIKETERQLKSTLKLEKETTTKKRSTVKKEVSTESKPKGRKKKSKYDHDMGSFSFHE